MPGLPDRLTVAVVAGQVDRRRGYALTLGLGTPILGVSLYFPALLPDASAAKPGHLAIWVPGMPLSVCTLPFSSG